jgi:N6-L-threonylcarbamoyladenine synthase
MNLRILGIESSCDETAAAVVADGSVILSNVVASQMDIHQKYGGVVPELASRQHLRSIVPVVREALERAGMKLADVDAIAVTQGPGLVGSLLVGLTYGKVLALSLGKPLVAVNHIEGHVHAVFLEARQNAGGQARQEVRLPITDGAGKEPAGSRRYEKEPELPAVCLIVSGGHTVLYEVSGDGRQVRQGNHTGLGNEEPAGSRRYEKGPASPGRVLCYKRLGQTRDDAAGEAYDKVARLLGLGYPGGPVIDQLAAVATKEYSAIGKDTPIGRAAFPGDGIRFGAVKIKGRPYDFSFSGIKTAVLYHLRKHPEFEPEIAARRAALARGERNASQLRPLVSDQTLDLLVKFQRTVVSELVKRTLRAAEETGAHSVLVSGGVAANGELRATFERQAARRGLEVFFPSRELSTDNAAMIAAAAYPKLVHGELQGEALNAEAVLPLA